MNSVQLLSLDSSIEPLWALIICRERLRPMPLPLLLVVKNGIKICSRHSSGMGTPLFVTCITVCSCWFISALMCIDVASACIAFFIKLMKMRLI